MEEEIKSFLNFLSIEKGFSENTITAYGTDLAQFVAFLNEQATKRNLPSNWSHIDRPLLLDYVLSLKEKSYASATVARKVSAVKSCFDFLTSEGILASNVAEVLSSPKVGKALPKVLSIKEVDGLLEQPAKRPTPEAKRDKAMLELLYATGMRVTELTSLNLGDANLKAGFVRCLGKGSKERIIPIHGKAAQAVADYLEEARPHLLHSKEEALFLNRRGQRLTRQGFWLLLKGYAKEAKIGAEITPHTLRHSIATHLLHSGKMNLRELQEFLGHANIATTQVYTHISNDHLRRVYERSHPRAR